MKDYIIAEYNLDDEIIDIFENYKELAEEYQTTLKSAYCMISRQASGLIDKSYNKTKNVFTKLYKINIKENEIINV